MEKRSSVQITIDENQNLRINNLSLDEYAKIFDEYLDENILLNDFALEAYKPVKIISDIEKDIESVIELYKSCEICFRNCKINRMMNGLGWCRLNADDNVYMACLLNDEEKIICPTYAIYLSSCNINCEYCHQKSFMKPIENNYIRINNVIDDIKENLDTIKTISFIGGNPEISFLTILRIIKLLVQENIQLPLVFNSAFLFTEKLQSFIEKYFDVLIPDLKFWDDNCSKKLCGFGGYRDIVIKNIFLFFYKKQIILRHLPLSGHWECCSKPIIDWIANNVAVRDLCSIEFLDLLQFDNSSNVKKCKTYAKKLKLILN